MDKPTVAAWLTNQLVRVHREEVDALLELGADLREVMADLSGDELRELTRQRHQLVLSLVQQARSLGRSLGQPISEGVTSSVRETLEATLSRQFERRRRLVGPSHRRTTSVGLR
ncbi:MAG: hypothetical protein WKF73_10745 [Nocardioidaceae bacterium]